MPFAIINLLETVSKVVLVSRIDVIFEHRSGTYYST
jgi:hypothetical protein